MNQPTKLQPCGQALLGVLVCLLLGLSQAGCAAPTKADEEAIVKLYENWREAVVNADIPAYVRVLDPDVTLMPPGAADIVGASNYAEFLKPVFATADYSIDVVEAPAVEVLGDLALARYTYVIHLDLKDPNQGVTESGALTASQSRLRYFDVLRRQPTGDWGVWRHTWSDAPPP